MLRAGALFAGVLLRVGDALGVGALEVEFEDDPVEWVLDELERDGLSDKR